MQISTRQLGKRKPLLSDFSIDPPQDWGDSSEHTLRKLIEHIVRVQVGEYNTRQDALRFDRVLSQDQIEKGRILGKVDPASKDTIHEADPEQAIATAIVGFEDGLYKVIIDESDRTELDAPVYLTPDSTIVFLRLTFLAGG